jgi:hypothetical protein
MENAAPMSQDIRVKGPYRVVRLRISSQNGVITKYSKPCDVENQQSLIIESLNGELTSRYLKNKKSKINSSFVSATFGLLCADGSPQYIGVMRLEKRKVTYIRVVVGQSFGNKIKCVKFNIANPKYSSIHDAFLDAVAWLSLYLNLNEKQRACLVGSWKAFLVKYQALLIG